MNLIRPALLLGLLAAAATAQPKPDFSGVWKLNLEESDYSRAEGRGDPTLQLPKPESMTRVIEHRGKDLRYKAERSLRGRKYEFEVEVEIGGDRFSSNAAGVVQVRWKGMSLEVQTVYNPSRERTERTEIWTLSPDGKKLLDEMTFRAADGVETKVRRVFDKQ